MVSAAAALALSPGLSPNPLSGLPSVTCELPSLVAASTTVHNYRYFPRFVATKTPEQQSCLMLHRTRHLFVRQQTAVINSIRAHLAEFGIVAPVGRKGVDRTAPRCCRPE